MISISKAAHLPLFETEARGTRKWPIGTQTHKGVFLSVLYSMLRYFISLVFTSSPINNFQV